jgi:hypothetical protein
MQINTVTHQLIARAEPHQYSIYFRIFHNTDTGINQRIPVGVGASTPSHETVPLMLELFIFKQRWIIAIAITLYTLSLNIV